MQDAAADAQGHLTQEAGAGGGGADGGSGKSGCKTDSATASLLPPSLANPRVAEVLSDDLEASPSPVHVNGASAPSTSSAQACAPRVSPLPGPRTVSSAHEPSTFAASLERVDSKEAEGVREEGGESEVGKPVGYGDAGS